MLTGVEGLINYQGPLHGKNIILRLASYKFIPQFLKPCMAKNICKCKYTYRIKWSSGIQQGTCKPEQPFDPLAPSSHFPLLHNIF